MNKTKVWVLIAIVLIVTGGAGLTAVLAVNDWSFNKVNKIKEEEKEVIIEDGFSDISIDLDTTELFIVKSKENVCKVVFLENNRTKHSALVNNGTLEIKVENKTKWYENILNFGFGNTNATVYLPEDEYGKLLIKEDTGDVKIEEGFVFESADIANDTGDISIYSDVKKDVTIKCSTGNIKAEGISAKTLNAKNSTGSIELNSVEIESELSCNTSTGKIVCKDVNCGEFAADASTGKCELENVIAKNTMNLKDRTGNIRLKDCDANEVYIKNDTGSVTGSFLTDKIIFAKSSTGSVDVPALTSGGRCEITTDTGDIEIEIADR